MVLRLLTAPFRLRKLRNKIAVHEAEIRRLKAERALKIVGVIGGITLLWAKLESHLDEINELAFLNGARDLIDAEIPRALDRKLDFMRRSHNRLPWLQDAKTSAKEIIDEFKALRSERHQLIHGVVQNLDGDDELRFVRAIHGAGPLEFETQEFSSERFLGISQRMAVLLKLIFDHISAMNQALLQYRLDQIKR